MYGHRRRAAPSSPLQRFEFLVFLVPLFFFVAAFVSISMTIVPDPQHSRAAQGMPPPPALQPRTALKAGPSPHFLCGHSMAGVAAAEWSDYCRGAGEFVCRSSRELIGSAQVNDDFCDCADGSDEVGTSACSLLSLARFACKAQQPVSSRTGTSNHSSPHRHTSPSPTRTVAHARVCCCARAPQMSIPTSMVNDGICDCCDGYDLQWTHTRLIITHRPSVLGSPARCQPSSARCGACRSDEWASNACTPRCTSDTATHSALAVAPPHGKRTKRGQG